MFVRIEGQKELYLKLLAMVAVLDGSGCIRSVDTSNSKFRFLNFRFYLLGGVVSLLLSTVSGTLEALSSCALN